MAEYADAVVVSAAILQRAGMPAIVQGFWTERSERSVLPTALSVLGVNGRWKFEGVAKLQLKFAVAAREENRYHTLGECEVASSLQDWLRDRHAILEETAAEIAEKLAEKWRTGSIRVERKTSSWSFRGAIFRLQRSGAKGCWMGRRREFKSLSSDSFGLIKICKLVGKGVAPVKGPR